MHPRGFKTVDDNNKECKREYELRFNRFMLCHAPNGEQGCGNEDDKDHKANRTHLKAKWCGKATIYCRGKLGFHCEYSLH